MSATATAVEQTNADTPAPANGNGVPTVQTPEFYRRKLSKELRDKRHELRRANGEADTLKAQAKDASTRVARLTLECDEICGDMEDLENGCYTPPELRPHTDDDPDDSVAGAGLEAAAKAMHKRQGGGVPFDAGSQAKLDVLMEFGLTMKQVEMIQESELAKKFDGLLTVGQLEKAMRDDEWWHRKIKGIGKTKVDQVSDAIVAFRASNPVPSADDPTPAAPLTDERLFAFPAGSEGGSVGVLCGESKGTWFGEAKWSFGAKLPELTMPKAGEGETREAAIRTAVRRVLVETRESPNAPAGWVADIEAWLRSEK